MSPARPYGSHCTGRQFSGRVQGFTLIELMVGLVVGLISTLAITQIMLVSEGQKRTTTSGSDAQISGVLALDTLRNSIQTAGYGFSSLPRVVGCPLEAKFNNAAVPGFPANLVPVVITDGASDAPDAIRVLASSKTSFSVPLTVIDPGYNPAVVAQSTAFPVLSVSGVAAGDLMVAATDATTKCQVFQATAAPTTNKIDRADDPGKWNAIGFPSLTFTAPLNSSVLNLGELDDISYSVSAAGSLQFNKFGLNANSVPSYSGNTDVYSNIVNMQAYYGKASTITAAVLTGPIDTWDTTLPTTNIQWLQVLAVKIALVSRSDQYEKTEVTTTDPIWDVGANSPIAGAVTCPTSANKCITLKIPRTGNSTDWKHYRYKVFDTVIPLRNMIWNS